MRVFRPIDDQVLVRQPSADDMQGKLHIPGRAQVRPLEGEVLAVGPGRYNGAGQRVPMQVRPGDVVLFGRYTGEDLQFDGVQCMVLREADVLGVVGSA